MKKLYFKVSLVEIVATKGEYVYFKRFGAPANEEPVRMLKEDFNAQYTEKKDEPEVADTPESGEIQAIEPVPAAAGPETASNEHLEVGAGSEVLDIHPPSGPEPEAAGAPVEGEVQGEDEEEFKPLPIHLIAEIREVGARTGAEDLRTLCNQANIEYENRSQALKALRELADRSAEWLEKQPIEEEEEA